MKFNYPKGSLYDLIESVSEKYPRNIAYEYFGRKASFTQFDEEIKNTAEALYQIGVREDDVVSICMPNTPEAITLFYAVNYLGAVANMIHPLSAEAEILHYFTSTKTKYAFTIDLAWKKVEAALAESSVEKCIVLSVSQSMPLMTKLGYSLTKGRKIPAISHSENVLSWKTFLGLGKNSQVANKEIRGNKKGEDLAVILHTGGTTGLPKGIMLSNLNFNACALQAAEACGGLSPGDSHLAVMPIFHGFGLGVGFHTIFAFGGKSIILPKFDSRNFHKLLKRHRPNILAGVPTLYEALLRNEKVHGMDLSFIKCAISGGDSLSVNLKEKLDRFLYAHGSKVPVREGYGLTETVTGSCLVPADIYKDNTVGLPYPDTRFKIVTPKTLDPLPALDHGEIIISGLTVMMGYLGDEDNLENVLEKDENGDVWLHTGDIGWMDEDGFVFFKQRINRMIISSGYNIYPESIENTIDSHEGVMFSSVVGVSHTYKGEVPVAFVVLKEGVDKEKAKAEIEAICEKQISTFALPYRYHFLEALPKTLVGKIDYTSLITIAEKAMIKNK